MNKKILFIQIEFPLWEQAKSWSYPDNYGFIEGLRLNGHRVEVLPIFCNIDNNVNKIWCNKIAEYISNKSYDIAFIDLVHPIITNDLAEAIRKVTQIRVGVIVESLEYSDADLAECEKLKNRTARFTWDSENLDLTHALFYDEADVKWCKNNSNVKAAWLPPSVPEKLIKISDPPKNKEKAIFIGSLYEKRQKFMQNTELQNLIMRPQLREVFSDLPKQFDMIQAQFFYDFVNRPFTEGAVSEYSIKTDNVREKIFRLLLEDYRLGFANVNLPSFVKSFHGRMIEGAAAGVPSITWKIEDRPSIMTLFDNNKEILTYDKDDPSSLAKLVVELKTNDSLRKEMVVNCRNKILFCHTSEMRCAQVMRWLTNPSYSALSFYEDYIPSFLETEYYQDFFTKNKSWNSPDANNDEKDRYLEIKSYLENVRGESNKKFVFLT